MPALFSRHRRSTLGRSFLLLSALKVAVVAGCAHPGPQDPARTGPFYTPTNYSGDVNLGEIRRVVVMPLWAGRTASVESAASLDPIILAALQASKRFEVVSLSREDILRRFRAESFSSAAELPHDLMTALQREFDADAVLLVDLTVYRPHRPLALGFRAKLATLNSARLIWTFDNLFSAEDASVANAARNHFLDLDQRIPADLTHSALQSPSRFAAYVSTAMFATLPPVAAKPGSAPVPVQNSR